MNKIGLIGLGSIGKKHIVNLKKLNPSVAIGVVSPSGKIYQSDSNYTSFDSLESLLKFEPEAIIIASPAPMHARHIFFFQQAGIPVLVEKPLVDTYDKLLSCVINHEKLAIAYCLRYLPATNKVKEIIDSGELGTIYNVIASVGQYLPDWRKDKNYKDSVSASKSLGGGVLLELSHEIDMVNFLFGNLSFQYARLRKNQELALDVEEIADVVLLSQKNIVCNIHLDFLQKVANRQLTITGSRGALYWDLIENKVTQVSSEGKETILDDTQYDKNNMYLNMLQDFFRLVSGKENGCPTLQEGIDVVRIIDEIKAKASWG